MKPTNTPMQTVKITKPTITKALSKSQVAKAQPKQIERQTNKKSAQKVYIVQAGDSLWKIAESEYKSGYKWVDIAKENKLADPSNIHRDDKLVLPSVSPKMVAGAETQVSASPNTQMSNSNTQNDQKIMGNSYIVQKGDNLWTIAVRSYGDGYQWTKIAQSNNLASPGVIHSGNVLQIPR
jgi:nucleoid-associated protein YgaU